MKAFSRKQFLKFVLVGAGLAKVKNLGAQTTPSDTEKGGERAADVIELKGKTIRPKKLVLGDNAAIIGPGTVILENGTAPISITGKNVVIRDCRIVALGGMEGQTSAIHLGDGCEAVSIENCMFEGSRYCVLKADKNGEKDAQLTYKAPVRELRFCDNTVRGAFSRHLYLHSVHGLLIRGNSFENSIRDSIRLRQAVKSVIISQNRFRNIGVKSKESSDAIDSYWSGEELIIEANTFENIATHGLDIKGISPDRDSSSSKVVIKSNIIKNCEYSGILLSSGEWRKGKRNVVERFVIDSNIITGCNKNGANPNDAAVFLRHGVRRVTITSNDISCDKSHGIVLGNFEPRAIQSGDIIIAQNQVSCSEKGNSCVVNFAAQSVLLGNNIFTAAKGGKTVENHKSYKGFKNSRLSLGSNLESVVDDNSGDDNA